MVSKRVEAAQLGSTVLTILSMTRLEATGMVAGMLHCKFLALAGVEPEMELSKVVPVESNREMDT